MTVLVRRPVPPVQRLALAAAGLGVALWPVWDLRHAFLSPSLVTPFFAVIALGAATLGVTVCAAALMATGELWEEAPGGLRRTAHGLLGRRVELIGPTETADIVIRTHDWESRPPTFAPVIVLRDGRRLTAPDTGAAEVEALAARLRAILRPGR